MHDIDRALYETEQYEGPYGEAQQSEFQFGEFEQGGSGHELALATELLQVTSEAELDQFLGNLISGAVKAARGFASSDAGRAVGGLLKSAARQALPQIGQALGNVVAPGMGGDLGRRAGQWLGGRFELGLEMEGLSAEDREFETARSFVRFAEEAAQRTAQAAPRLPAAVAAQRAAVAAAQHHLPGLVRPPTGGTANPPAAQGRWVRRGKHIVILGA